MCALLAALLPLDRLFGADLEDGSLDLLLLSGLPASGIAAAKALAHWLVTGVPLLVAAAPVAVMLRMPEAAIPALLVGLLLGSLLLSLFGGMGAAIVLGARRGGVLLPLLVLPLVTPVLIFGAAAADAAAGGFSPRPHLLLLGAMLAAALPLCPLAAWGGVAGGCGVAMKGEAGWHLRSREAIILPTRDILLMRRCLRQRGQSSGPPGHTDKDCRSFRPVQEYLCCSTTKSP